MRITNKHATFDHVEEFLKDHYKNIDATIVLGYLMYTYEEILTIKSSSKKLIILQLEQVSPHLFSMNVEWLDILYAADELWDYDQLNAIALKTYGLNVEKIVKFDYTESLNKIAHIEKDMDILFYGSVNEKRSQLFDVIQTKIPNSLHIVNAFGSELDNYISRSKIILNCHYYETDVQEQVRIFYPLCNGSCIVSEYNAYNNFGDNIYNIKRENLADALRSILKTEAWKSKMRHVRKEFMQCL